MSGAAGSISAERKAKLRRASGDQLVFGVRGLTVLALLGLALAGCGRRGDLEAPPGSIASGTPAISPPAPGSGGPNSVQPFVGPGSNPTAAPRTAVVGEPVTAPARAKRAPKPADSFFLDPLL